MDSSSDDDWDDLRSASPASQYTSVTLDDDAHSAYQLVVASSTASPANHLSLKIIDNIISLFDTTDLIPLARVNKIWSKPIVARIWHDICPKRVGQLQAILEGLENPQTFHPYANFIHKVSFRLLFPIGTVTEHQLLQFKSCVNLHRLNILGCSHITSQFLAELLPNFPSLESLQAANDQVSDTVLLAAPSTLRGVRVTNAAALSDLGVVDVAKRSALIERAVLTENQAITDEAIVAIVDNSPRLVELRVGSCPLITDRSVRQLHTRPTRIRRLDLSNCRKITGSAFTVDASETQGEDIPSDVTANPPSPPILDTLRLIDVSGCYQLTDAAIEAIVVAAPRLREIRLNHCGKLTDSAVLSLCNLSRHLHSVQFGHV